ncbi:hypothetical protein NHX12_028555 [Muraenolepis orangiensis]|uniref:Glycosyl transferase family 1 domain-containing protein n=1 Tax=Muraenolepis orangiensis TaxID=630683 RepID=A0A9Q0EAF4_9TELE|nr:hypothetical protein NHX12_028555 [Muraenolepis orangiensis]
MSYHRTHIESAGHTCVLRDASDFKSSAEVAKFVTQTPPFEGALAIHLFKAGRLLLGNAPPSLAIHPYTHTGPSVSRCLTPVLLTFKPDVPLPFGVVFGGTDLNEDVKVEHKLVVMKQVLLKASHVEQHRVFLLVCGLRRVKDPLYLAEVFTEWHRQDPLNVLVIIGPEIDAELTEEVEAVAQRRAGVFLARGRSRPELHAAVRRCFAVVNSSVSEGMSAAILEAMHLEVPVVARDIPGNAAVVQHNVTGLLYSTPQEFVCQSQRLLSDGELRKSVVRKAKLYVEHQHSIERERDTYHSLVQTLQ